MKENKNQKNTAVNQITEGVIWKQLLFFFFPILFGTLFQQIYNTADTVVVGRFVGKEALAAVGGSSSMIVNLIVGILLYKKNVLIFDDVMTSSNTLQAAFQQVEKYHPKQIKALVLACPHIDYFKK